MYKIPLNSQGWKKERPVVVILSGAGLSAESGIPTYRVPQSNWKTTNAFDAEEAKRNPQLFLRETNERIREWKDAKPNAAHSAIADFTRRLRDRASILHITQNIDALSEDAGDTSVFHLHGSILKSRCQHCGAHFPRLAPTHSRMFVLRAENRTAPSGPTSCFSAMSRTAWTGFRESSDKPTYS